MDGLMANRPMPPSSSSLPPPKPEWLPPEFRKHRALVNIQVLEREIGFLQEEVISVEGIEPASRSCKEIVDFMACNADPLIPLAKKNNRWRGVWKWLCCSGVGKIPCCGCFFECSCRCSDACARCWKSQCFSESSCSSICNSRSTKRCRGYCCPKCPEG